MVVGELARLAGSFKFERNDDIRLLWSITKNPKNLHFDWMNCSLIPCAVRKTLDINPCTALVHEKKYNLVMKDTTDSDRSLGSRRKTNRTDNLQRKRGEVKPSTHQSGR